jgi:hypothetical protein
MRLHVALYTNMSVLEKKAFLSADVFKCTKDSGGCRGDLDILLQSKYISICKILYSYAYLNASCAHLFKKFLKSSGKAFVALLAEGEYLFVL